MTIFLALIARARRSRIAMAVSAVVLGLVLSTATPSIMSALGGLSPPVGCHSDVVGDHSDPCVLVPGTDVDGGTDNNGGSGVDGDGGSGVDGGTGDVVRATPTFTG